MTRGGVGGEHMKPMDERAQKEKRAIWTDPRIYYAVKVYRFNGKTILA